MSQGLNKTYLIGNIGEDPEMRTTAMRRKVVKLSLATPNTRKAGEETVDVPDWHRVTFFDDLAEYVSKYAKKGDVLAVECAIRPKRWADKDNVVRYEVCLRVERVLWLNGEHRSAGNLPTPPRNVHHDAIRRECDDDESPATTDRARRRASRR